MGRVVFESRTIVPLQPSSETYPAGVRTMHSMVTNAMLTRKDLGAIGAAKLLKVMSGDKIQTSVQFHYTATNANNSSASGINSLVANITQLFIQRWSG